MLLVMFFLFGDVFCDRCDVRFADAEHSVSGLPSKRRAPFRADPFGGVRLDHASDFRGGLGWSNADEQMNMIGGAVNDQRRSLHFADDASEVSKQIFTKLWLNHGTPPLGAEDQMQQNIARSMRQAPFAPAGASPFVLAYPRLAPWAGFLRRYRGFLIITVARVTKL